MKGFHNDPMYDHFLIYIYGIYMGQHHHHIGRPLQDTIKDSTLRPISIKLQDTWIYDAYM